MKNYFLALLVFGTLSLKAQYCVFFDFKAENPEMVVSTITAAMNTEWAKNMQATKSLFAYLPNGSTKSTHSNCVFQMRKLLKVLSCLTENQWQ
jgi:hypothetical protein